MSNNLFRSSYQQFKNGIRPSTNIRQNRFVDKLQESKNIEFKHSWANMAHMHALRVWTLAYAPSTSGNLQRMQECHRLNGEMWYMIHQSMWKRTIILVVLFFVMNKLMRKRIMDNGEKDTHDMSWRDMHSHM